ncbi:chromosome segregation protein SMC [Fontivita pretiosa]|uniref:chromosome segregation protein SMC n=1 Tax=Fontivita pretiosa TaxID=2989684 RepID=UPI003D173E48
MRLKKLILHGFKSFADRTEFVFDAPITGIVGPNGCGKSNVVDGFKWVLGEQSAKSLRGEAMMDVIFNGSGNRKPAGMAEVVLVFDNPRRPDGSRLLNVDSDEVYVGRRLFRDGTSEYQLNNQTCRLKDIRELFLDTGVGVDAYSVIEQGKVTAMLEADPEQRRLIFEEAAGISKYKVKKKEAQRKLERVEQNLLRLNDIVQEVEKRLRSVKAQAGRARTYQEYTARLNELRLSHSLHEYHTLRVQADELERNRDDAQFRLDDVNADLQRSRDELAGRNEQLQATAQARQQAEYELVQAAAQLQSARQRQQYAQQQLRQICEQADAFSADRAAAEQKLSQTVAALEAQRQILSQLSDEVESRRRQIDARQQAFRDGQLQLNELNQQLEQAKAQVLDLMRQSAAAGSRLSSIQIELKNIAAHQSRLEQRRQQVLAETQSLQSHRQQLQQRLEQVIESIQQQQAAMSRKRSESAALGRHIAQLGEQLGAAKEHRSGLLSRQKLLADLEARREGVSEGVKSVLRQRGDRFPFVRGIVADVLRVDVEHAQVIEAALNGHDQTLIADSQQAATSAPEALAELGGRVSFLCVDRLDGAAGAWPVPQTQDRDRHQPADAYDWNIHPHRIRFAADLVRFEPVDRRIVDHLLGRTVVVQDLAAARELHQAGPRGYRYVTHAGEVIEADGTVRAGPLTAAMGLLSRRSELEAIRSQIAEVDARIEALTQQLTDGNAQAQQLEDQINALRNAIYQANTEKVELSSQMAQADDRLAALDRELPLLERELSALVDQVGRLQAEQTRLEQQKQSLESQQAEDQQRIEQMSQRQQQLAEELRVCGEELTSCRVALGQVQEKQLAAEQAAQRQAMQQTELTQQIERIDKSVEQLVSRRSAVEQELASAQHAEEALGQRQQELSQRLELLSRQLAEAQQAVAGLSHVVEQIQQRHAQIEQELHQIQLRSGELKVRLETLVQRTMDELQIDLPGRYQALFAAGEDGAPGPGYQPAQMDWDAVAEEIRQLREKIHRLGNVNLDSIGEMQELEQRQQFLATQVQDLTTSRQQLEELIDTINRESSIRFEQTFNAVREHFQGIFRKLFGGGKADIYLETELEQPAGEQAPAAAAEQPSDTQTTAQPTPKRRIDILDAGIEIIARPPGKQPATIAQLSGGEKAMTCIALLLSIFKSKPSPFCILDEVDAPLDEANNQRFNLIIQEFLEMSQFIIITHSKRTMQIADVLYGVTMQEQGVSRRVAVKFEQIDAQGRIREAEHAAA